MLYTHQDFHFISKQLGVCLALVNALLVYYFHSETLTVIPDADPDNTECAMPENIRILKANLIPLVDI